MNAAWGFNKNYGFNQRSLRRRQRPDEEVGQEVDLTLWYRPVEALKFGLNYAYERTDFLQNTMPAGQESGKTNVGQSQRLEFVAYMFF